MTHTCQFFVWECASPHKGDTRTWAGIQPVFDATADPDEVCNMSGGSVAVVANTLSAISAEYAAHLKRGRSPTTAAVKTMRATDLALQLMSVP